ncbi:MFS transporter [Methanofollis fontis]|uniref:MFS transporter n=1 Tax=Methanofollis fontis TaxID=2052832 RepID=A0A483CQP1_9EURY|nr:MFS transporter [Methanofollis fontis]TAJ43327.1 MFS transporter [Methanofollis fontis]
MMNAASGAEKEKRGTQRAIIFVIALAAFMGSLDVSIVNISLPTIAASFGIGTGPVSWVSIAYLLVLSSFLPAFGKIGDRIGFRPVFLSGFTIFLAGSLLCGLATDILPLIAFRVLQAIGAAMLTAIGPAMVSTLLPAAVRGTGLGITTSFASLGIAAGPAVGGFLTAYLTWRWIFFINIPVGLVALLLAVRVIPSLPVSRPETPFDLGGAALIFGALGSGIFALNMGQNLGWTSTPICAAYAAALILSIAFFVQERRHPEPVIDLHLFSNRSFSFANAAALLLMLVYTGAIFLFPFYLELVRGYTPDISGLVLMVPSVMMLIAGPIAGRLSDRFGSRGICTVATAILCISFLLFSGLDGATPVPFMLLSLALMGTATGLFIPPSSSLILRCSPADRQGMASSVMMAIRDGGAVVGVAVFEALFAAAVVTGAIPASVDPAALVGGFQTTFLAGAVVAGLATLCSFSTRDP